MNIRYVVASLGIALIVVMGSVRAADEWFVMGEQALSDANPSVEIKSSGGRWEKDVKQIKFSVDGGDVEITNAVEQASVTAALASTDKDIALAVYQKLKHDYAHFKGAAGGASSHDY